MHDSLGNLAETGDDCVDSQTRRDFAIGTGAAVKWPASLTMGRPLTEKLPADFDRVEQLV